MVWFYANFWLHCWPWPGMPHDLLVVFFLAVLLTPSVPAVPNCYCLKCSAAYWSNPPFLIVDIRALRTDRQSAQCQQLKMVG